MKKPNPKDSTNRNVQAVNKKIAAVLLGELLASVFPCGNMICGTVGRCRCSDPLPRLKIKIQRRWGKRFK